MLEEKNTGEKIQLIKKMVYHECQLKLDLEINAAFYLSLMLDKIQSSDLEEEECSNLKRKAVC